MDVDLRLVRYFVAVADELHFGRAAAKLYISQPALSKQIRKLEAQVGAPLLIRDSRHVTLTPRGQRFAVHARQLLTLAERMGRDTDPNVVRIAHIFELTTSRYVADAFTRARPDVELVERSMNSTRQLDALMNGLLDVAIIRVTATMLADKPAGWHHRLLRLEPMLLVGRPGDPECESASFHARSIEVFGDPQGSGMYNVHGEYLTALERHLGCSMRWLGNPGTFDNCYAAVSRASEPVFVLEFESYADRYAERGLPVYRPVEFQPLFPFSLAWRAEEPSEATSDFLRVAQETSEQRGWLRPVHHADAPLWLPQDDPAAINGRVRIQP